MRLVGVLLAAVGAGVLTLPVWLPRVADVTVTPETFERAGQVGGALAGFGVLVFVIGLFRRRRG